MTKKRRNKEINRSTKDDDDKDDDDDDQKIKKKEKKKKKKNKRRKLNDDDDNDDNDNVDSSSNNDKHKENKTLLKKLKKHIPETSGIKPSSSSSSAAASSMLSPEKNDVTQQKLSKKKKKKETKKAQKKKRKREEEKEEEEKEREQTSESATIGNNNGEKKSDNGNSKRWSNHGSENDSKGVERKKKDPKKKKQEKQSKTKKTKTSMKTVSQSQSADADDTADTAANADTDTVDYTDVAAKNARIVESFARECSNAERKAKSVCPPTITKRKFTKRPKIGHDPTQEKEQQQQLQQQQQHDIANDNGIVEVQQQQQQKQDTNNNNDDSNINNDKNDPTGISLLLFYQYIEPEWDEPTYESIVYSLTKLGNELSLTGRMRCAKEGLNCTLTGTPTSIMEFQTSLQQLRPRDFRSTEFKITTNLPRKQRFPELKVLQVLEIVRYGLEGTKAPQLTHYAGVHLEPHDYHTKLAEANTVIIDVRNHYEAAIGRFVPPTTHTNTNTNTIDSSNDEKSSAAPPVWLDPKMRKSTEFPAWLDHPDTKKQLQGKQVLMYCTGGIRCERASSLLKYKMDNDPTTKALGIQGVYQLQGGIDKYFKEFPQGGYWQGKNYVFDKRFAHAPPQIQMAAGNGDDDDGRKQSQPQQGMINNPDKGSNKSSSSSSTSRSSVPTVPLPIAMGKCESCFKPWDMYRGKRRCPTCGVPSLICKECFATDKEAGKGGKKSKLKGRDVRCELCVEQNIRSKKEYKLKDQQVIHDYETKMISQGLFEPAAAATNANTNKKKKNGHTTATATTTTATALVSNPQHITRLVVKGMCRTHRPTVEAFKEAIQHPTNRVTHLVWRMDHQSGDFSGMGWMEMETAAAATRVVSLAHAKKIQLAGRTVTIAFQPPNGKDVWPHPNNKV